MEQLDLSAVPKNDDNPSMQKKDTPSRSSNNKISSKVSFFGIFGHADKTDCVLMLFGSIGACVHGAALPIFFLLFGNLIDSMGSLSTDLEKMSSKISKNSLDLVYLGLVVMASAWIGVAFWMQTGERQTARLRVRYLQSILKQDIDFFDTKASDEDIIFRISSDAILVQDAIGDKIGHCLRYLSQFVSGFALGFFSVWQLTLLTVAVVPLIAIAGGIYTVTISSLSKKSEASYAEASKVAEEIISQIRTVYSYVGEDKAVEAYSESLKNASKLEKKGGIAKGIGVGFTYGLLFCAWALLLWYSSILVRHKVTTGAKAFTTIINTIFSGFALGQAAPNLAAVAKGRAAASNIMNMIEPDENSFIESDIGITLPKVEGQIEFCEVSFAYPSRSNMVFECLSFSISAGMTVAFVGHSGSGKSTVISMLERFYDPTSGKILLDGHDLKSLQLKWLREQMGLVSQEPALFATTIAENIRYGRESANFEQIIEATRASNAHSFIQSLPDGYSTQVGEGGTQLSGGQKQRIAIARALLRNPKILLLDEATSALDSESELLVQKELNKIVSNRTTIVVAHRLSTIRDVDKIIVLKNGQVVESGTHFDLMSRGKDGEYFGLVKLQVSSNAEDEDHGDKSSSRLGSSIISDNGSQYQNKMADKRELTPDNHELVCRNSNSSSSIVKLVKMNKPEWPFAVLGSVGAILAGMEAPLFALGVTHILNVFYSQNDSQIKQEMRLISLIFMGAGAVTIPIYFLQHYFFTLMGERLSTRVRLFMFSAILRNEIGWFDLDENNTGYLISNLAASATLVRSTISDRLSTIMQNIALTATAFVIAFAFSWQMASVVIATFPLLIAASITEQLFLKGFGGDYTSSYSRATSLAREAITNIRTVAAFGAEERISTKYAYELSLPNKKALLRGHISGLGYGFCQLCSFSSKALGLWYGSTLIKNGQASFGDIMKAFMVLIVTVLSVAETLALAPNIVLGSQALESVFRILDRGTAIDSNDPSVEVVRELKGDIEFKNVSFRYPSRMDITVLENLCLQVSAGSSLALVGQSGSGKSSIVSLIMRFYDPNSGQILIDGCDIKSLNLKSMRLKIGLVQQEPALFSSTIYENILYGKEGASEIEIIKAAKAANAHEFISRMPNGYHTKVGERGVQLSGGQKQRVAIARAILKDPSILILDEATSALDMASEMLVQEALDKLMERRTSIIVAHRLSSIRNVNKISVLQYGKVVEMGSHEELMNKSDSIYAQLVSLQQRNNGVLT